MAANKGGRRQLVVSKREKNRRKETEVREKRRMRDAGNGKRQRQSRQRRNEGRRQGQEYLLPCRSEAARLSERGLIRSKRAFC